MTVPNSDFWSLQKENGAPKWWFHQDNDNTPKLKTAPKINFGLQTAQDNFEVANLDDPVSQITLARTWDKSWTFQLHGLDNKW